MKQTHKLNLLGCHPWFKKLTSILLIGKYFFSPNAQKTRMTIFKFSLAKSESQIEQTKLSVDWVQVESQDFLKLFERSKPR